MAATDRQTSRKNFANNLQAFFLTWIVILVHLDAKTQWFLVFLPHKRLINISFEKISLFLHREKY